MNVGSLFSGIGGMDAGLARAGHRHVFFCEADPYRRDVLAARWPGVPIYDDVAALRVEPAARAAGDGRVAVSDGAARVHTVPVPGLLCGGFPCQDLSVAGRRAGLAGGRSGLFFEFARIIDALRPGWVLIENVPGLLSSNGGRDFGVVLGTLADLGYGVAWRVLDSRFFGVPQRRRRVFIVGALADGDPRAAAARAGEVLAVGSRCPGHPPAGGKTGTDAAVASLSGLGSGGPDDNDGQANRVIAVNLRGREGGAMPELDSVASVRAASGGSSRSYVAHALTSEGFDASEDGTGRGTPLVAAPLTKGSATGEGVNQPGRRQEDDVNIVAFDWQAGAPQSDNDQSGGKGRKWIVRAGDYTGAIGETRRDAVGGEGIGVRRLTPRECERLQGLPDDWTRLDDKTPDSRRYSALGDAVTANVAEWIGSRFALVPAPCGMPAAETAEAGT